MKKTTKESSKDLFAKAAQQTKRQNNGHFHEDDLLANLASLIIIDPAEERMRRAKAIIDNLTKPGGTEPTGQLHLPGFDFYDYEPERLVRDDNGNVIEQDRALYRFKIIEAKRARKHAHEANQWAERKAEESEAFTLWVMARRDEGRTTNLTFGDFVRESKLFTPFSEAGAA